MRSPPASGASPSWPPTGLANREIAQALFVTKRTVEMHLTHAYQKLDAGSRAELRATLGSSGAPTVPPS